MPTDEIKRRISEAANYEIDTVALRLRTVITAIATVVGLVWYIGGEINDIKNDIEYVKERLASIQRQQLALEVLQDNANEVQQQLKTTSTLNSNTVSRLERQIDVNNETLKRLDRALSMIERGTQGN